MRPQSHSPVIGCYVTTSDKDIHKVAGYFEV